MSSDNKTTAIGYTKALLEASSCCAELKSAAQSWLDSLGTDNEIAAAEAYICELEEDVMPVDDTIAFFRSPAAVSYFGETTASALLKSLIDHKNNGGQYCNCPACSAGASVLVLKDYILK